MFGPPWESPSPPLRWDCFINQIKTGENVIKQTWYVGSLVALCE